ncbi:MAG TPA: hypothetical protein PKV42_01435 [Thiobacillus sp.]|jgi:hypothetical protein|nr:MAG: hypothetical protein B7Y27_06665 [Hydrogenophilales bacterium 16-64-40]OZA32273.1 MAG: hypothetical protein B7X82_13520 [Hydrogenophilales bacterium 17-64-65]HQS81097.1 hypothetical protein [Thiobacillus sp.]HQT32783.1 hypothetical protein [Thiobacillus sp.]
MIYIVEIPHQKRPHAWFAFSREDFVLKVRATHGPNVDQSGAANEFDACVATLADGLKDYRVHLSDELAIGALQSDPLYDKYDGFYAHMALREQLVAMDALEDDL